jgi:hypothetical protein
MLYETAERNPVLEVVGGRYGPGGVLFAIGPSVRSPLRCPLWPLWLTPWCQVSPLCRRGAVFAFAGPLIITAILSC